MSKFVILKNESLMQYNSWHVGGICHELYQPKSLDELSQFLAERNSSQPIIWLGLGSNVLIRDRGYAGTVIHTQAYLNKIAYENEIIIAEAGVTCAKLAKFAAQLGFPDSAFFAGIPGTVGGALAMNAGAFGHETWNHCIAVDTIDQSGKIHHRDKNEFEVGYREVKRKLNEWFVCGYFKFQLGDAAEASREIKTYLQKRNDTQPIGSFNCGSVFRNPPGNFAAKLIESCGLKGKRIGGAVVSEKHANFIINDHAATAADIENLIDLVQAEVLAKTGVQLVRECHIIGEK